MIDNKSDLMGKDANRMFASRDLSIKIAIIQRVDEVNLKADIKLLSGAAVEFKEVPLTQAISGPRSFLGGIPEVNSLALVGFRSVQSKLQAVCILGYLPTAIRSSWRFDPVSADDPNSISSDSKDDFERLFGKTTRFKRLYLKPGDIGGMSSQGAELTLKTDVSMSNRSGDSFELRDLDRTLVQSSIHRVQTESGIRRTSGPSRRSAIFLPQDVFEAGRTLRSPSSSLPYYGRDELQDAGPGADTGGNFKLCNLSGLASSLINDFESFPPSVYSSGKLVYYPPSVRGGLVDDYGDPADAYTEDRMEMSHTSDLTQEVLEEVDGFSVDRKLPYIERVYGTLVGNTLNSSEGQRQYAQVLKPRIFSDFSGHSAGKFTLESVDRSPTKPDLEVSMMAGAHMLRIRPPKGTKGEDGSYVHAVSKQGKTFLQLPGSDLEEGSTKNISAEINMLGALKAFIGASKPERISAHLTFEGGVHLDIGRDAQGNALTVQYHSGTKLIADGNPNANNVAVEEEIRGTKLTNISGKSLTTVDGSRKSTISGLDSVEADRVSVSAFNGATFNVGELNHMVAGKTQSHHAQLVQETIVTGGKTSTILAGGLTQSILLGTHSTTVTAGSTSFSNPAGSFSSTVGVGSYSVSVGTGSVSISTGVGSVSLSSGVGAVSITAGLAMNLTSGIALSLIAPQVLVGGPAAVLGVCRGTPSLPPGQPSLDIITNLPLFGSAVFRSI
jgi:hypothetical protein